MPRALESLDHVIEGPRDGGSLAWRQPILELCQTALLLGDVRREQVGEAQHRVPQVERARVVRPTFGVCSCVAQQRDEPAQLCMLGGKRWGAFAVSNEPHEERVDRHLGRVKMRQEHRDQLLVRVA